MYEDGADATAQEYRDKLKSLKALGDKIFFRRDQLTERPESVRSALSILNASRVALANITEERNVTQEEVDAALKSADEVEAWLIEQTKAQEALALHEDPLFTSDDVHKKMTQVQTALRRLVSKPKKKIPKPVKVELNTNEDDEEAEGQEEKEGHEGHEGSEKTSDTEDKEQSEESEESEKEEVKKETKSEKAKKETKPKKDSSKSEKKKEDKKTEKKSEKTSTKKEKKGESIDEHDHSEL